MSEFPVQRPPWLVWVLAVVLVGGFAAMIRELVRETTPDDSKVQGPFLDPPVVDLLPPLDEALAILGDAEASTRDRILAGKSVLKHGKQGVPALVRLLERRDPLLLTSVLALFVQLKTDGAEAAAPLRVLCAHEDPRIRRDALQAAWAVHEDKSPMRPILRSALKSGHSELGQLAVEYLGQLPGPPIEDLFEAVGTAPEPVKARSAYLLVRTAAASGDSQLLERLLLARDEFPRIRNSLRPPTERRTMIVWGDTLEPEQWKQLEQRLSLCAKTTADSRIRLAAILSLVQREADLTGERAAVLRAAAKEFRDSQSGREIIEDLFPWKHPCPDTLRELMKSTNLETRCVAAYWLLSTEPSTPGADVLPIFRETLRSKLNAKSYAVAGIEKLGPGGREALPELRALRRSPGLGPDVQRVMRSLETVARKAEPSP